MTELLGKDLTLGNRLVDADIALGAGELIAIVGPNGSGKSSLLRLLAGNLVPDSGSVQLDARPLASFDPRDRARRLSYLPQRSEVAWPIAVSDMVALGRFAFGGSLDDNGGAAPIVSRCLTETGCAHLASRSTATLSGGELALVALARVLAAETPLALLDEPTAALDPRRQLDVMTLLKAKADQGLGIAVVLHDLNLAAQFADRIYWMNDGRIAAESDASAAAVARHAAEAFGVTVAIGAAEDGSIASLAVRRTIGSAVIGEEPGVG